MMGSPDIEIFSLVCYRNFHMKYLYFIKILQNVIFNISCLRNVNGYVFKDIVYSCQKHEREKINEWPRIGTLWPLTIFILIRGHD